MVWASYRDLNWSFHIFVGRPWHLLPFRLFDRSTSGFGFQTFVPTVMVIYFDIFISVLISVIPKFFSSIFITAVVISFVAPSDRREGNEIHRKTMYPPPPFFTLDSHVAALSYEF